MQVLRNMIIECYGLPGTGKSTIAVELSSLLPGTVIRIERRKDFIWFNVLSFLKHPLKFIRRTVCVFYDNRNLGLLYYKLVRVFLYRNAVVEKARKYSLAIVDEGHLANILSGFEEPLSPEMLLKEIDNLELPDILLHFKLPEHERKLRLENRGFIPRNTEPQEYHQRWEKAMLANEQLFVKIVNMLPVIYICVDQHTTADVLSRKLKAMVMDTKTTNTCSHIIK